MGTRIVLADNTVIEDGECGYSEGFLWCYFSGYSLQDAAEMFFDKSKTERITFKYGDMRDVYEGFTNCVGFNVNSDGRISVCLQKEVGE